MNHYSLFKICEIIHLYVNAYLLVLLDVPPRDCTILEMFPLLSRIHEHTFI